VSSAICGELITVRTPSSAKPGCPEWWQGRKIAFAITEPMPVRIATTSRPPPLATATPGAAGHKYYISGVDVVRGAGRGPHRHIVGDRSGTAVVVCGRYDAAGLERTHSVEISSPEKQFTLFFDNVSVGSDRLIAPKATGSAKCSTA